MIELSPHFTLAELTFSQAALRRGIDNTPSVPDIDNLRRLCVTVLEPLRDLLGVPLHVDSGYRSAILNTLVGGATNSAHMEGRAVDIVPKGMSIHEAFSKIHAAELPTDQTITECNAWIHVSIANEGQPTRRLFMTASGSPGHWVYNYV